MLINFIIITYPRDAFNWAEKTSTREADREAHINTVLLFSSAFPFLLTTLHGKCESIY